MKVRNVLASLAVLTTLVVPTTMATISPASTEIRSKRSSATEVTVAAASVRTTAWNRGLAQKGDRYKYGGNGPSSWDCSGLTYYAYQHKIPRTSGAQRSSSKTKHVSRYNARRGDLVFWGSGHVELLSKVYKSNGKWYTQTFGAHSSRNPIVGYRTVSGVPHIETYAP